MATNQVGAVFPRGEFVFQLIGEGPPLALPAPVVFDQEPSVLLPRKEKSNEKIEWATQILD